MQNELVVRSEPVQRVFGFYKEGRLIVNRRYQRKLVWNVEEKQNFIDSILEGFPVPIFLFADISYELIDAFEIIDGMQRLNAVTSFIEGEFDIRGGFFDLETMVESKELLDNGELIQKQPKLSREKSSSIASYILPLSVYSFNDPRKVDEIFRRINSNGRYLSKQELRSAGTLGKFPDLVRKVSSEIREDATHSDVLPLSQMRKVSINNKNLNYGINSENIYWVKQGIITKEMLRQSKDEEIVADSIVYMAISDTQRSSSEVLDEYYGYKEGNKREDIETALQQVDSAVYREQYIKTHDTLAAVLDDTNQSFNQYCLENTSQKVPRYYEVVFLALYDLLFRENKEVSNMELLTSKLNNIGRHINITTGGNWSATNRKDNINAIKGILRDCFKDSEAEDPVTSSWVTEFRTLLIQSKTEQNLYDFKQGFLRLDRKSEFDKESFRKIIQTLTAMANHGPKALGCVCVGVADDEKTASRIKEIYEIEPEKFHDFYITGLDHEIQKSRKSSEEWFKHILSLIKSQPATDNFKENVSRNTRFISYKGRSVVVFRVKNLGEPAIFDGKYYQRHGPELKEVVAVDYPAFFKRF